MASRSTAAQDGALDWQTPVVEGVGPALYLPDAAVQPDTSLTYRVVFDVTRAGEGGHPPAGLSQVARFINSFALHGVDPADLDLVAVFHGPSIPAVLSDAAYAAHVGGENPSADLLTRLHELGVRVYVCGNALAGSGYTPDELRPDVELATSALAVLTTFQLRGYAVLDY